MHEKWKEKCFIHFSFTIQCSQIHHKFLKKSVCTLIQTIMAHSHVKPRVKLVRKIILLAYISEILNDWKVIERKVQIPIEKRKVTKKMWQICIYMSRFCIYKQEKFIYCQKRKYSTNDVALLANIKRRSCMTTKAKI